MFLLKSKYPAIILLHWDNGVLIEVYFYLLIIIIINYLYQYQTTPIMSATRSPFNDTLVKWGLAEFTRDIKLGKFERSYDVAKRTVVILNNMVKENSWRTARDLIDTLKAVCAYIDSLGLVETVAGNMTRRIMRIVRDECQNFNAQLRAQQEDTSFETSRDETTDANLDLDLNRTGVKENILEGIEQELLNELSLSSKSIAQQAVDYVQSDEIILTLGKSKVIESFLRHAAIGSKTGKRKFTVIVVELAPFYSGRLMAQSLNNSGISTLIIPDSAVFAIMSRVNKVIMSTHSMMANGGIKASAGSHSIALAAKHYAVPVIVCCPMYKLTPCYLVSHDTVAFKQFSHIHAAFPEPYTPPPSRGNDKKDGNPSASISGSVESLHSTFDYVPPELITLFVSNIGGNSPSYVYQLLNELYCKSDYLN